MTVRDYSIEGPLNFNFGKKNQMKLMYVQQYPIIEKGNIYILFGIIARGIN